MKVFFDSEIFGLQKRGGASNYWFEFMSRFIKEHDVTVYTMSDDKYLNKDFLKFKEENKLNTIPDKGFSASLLRCINPPKMKNKENLIFHSTAYRWVKKKSVKNIVTIHDFTHQVYFTGYHKLLNSWFKKRTIKRADGIVCISDSTYKDMLKFYPKAKNKKVAIIYNGFNSDYFHKLDDATMPEKYNELNGKKFILFVGQREGYKNFDFLIKVLEKAPDIDLALVGGRDFDINDEKYKNIKSQIHVLKNVDDTDLNILYNNSFCFIYPSLYEGFGIPVAEAMNAGCPVIAFNNSSIPEVMNSSGILLEDNDLDGTIKALKDLENEEFRTKLIEAQYEACKKFSWDQAYKDMVAFYEKVLND